MFAKDILFPFRFVILKKVPRDLLHELKVPKRILAYLDTPFYYSEQIADWADLEPQLAHAAAAATATGPESEPIPTEALPTGGATGKFIKHQVTTYVIYRPNFTSKGSG